MDISEASSQSLNTGETAADSSKNFEEAPPESVDIGSVSDIVEESVTMDKKSLNQENENSTVNEMISKEEESAEEDKTQSVNPESKNEGDDYMDILGNGLLKKKLLIPGNGVQSRPNNGDTVTLKILGKLEDGTQIENDETSFILNDGDVIVALDLCVALMESGEKCELITSSRYAYGELGQEPHIPKNASITYELELIDIKPQTDISSLTFQERLNHGENKRLRGNYLFGRGDYSGAINSYSKAVKVLDDTDLNAGLDESDRAQLEDSWTKCYNNMAACQLKIDAIDAAIRSAEKVLSSQSNNVKALFRLGKAYGAKGEVDKAILHLKKALQYDPESKMLHQELFTLTKRKNKETESERDLYRKMLGMKSNNKPKLVENQQKNSNSILKWALPVGGLAAVIASVGFAWYRNS